MSHTLISLPLFAQVGRDALTHPHILPLPAPSSPLLPTSPSPPFLYHIPSPSLALLSLSLPRFSLCLCSTGTCGPTEALGYTKKPKLAFICSLLPAVYIVHLCSLSAQEKKKKKSIDFKHDSVIIIAFESLLPLQKYLPPLQLLLIPYSSCLCRR